MKKEMTTIRRIVLLLMAAIMLCMTGVPIVAQCLVSDDLVADPILGSEDELMPMGASGCNDNAPSTPVKCSKQWLANIGIDDPEDFKIEYVGNAGSLYDIYHDTSNNNALWLGNKSGTVWIRCD